MSSTIIFDLDGTISDPKDGIVRSINYALEAHGFDSRAEAELLTCIGPPLDASFRELLETADESLVNSLVKKYRERYADVGFSENYLYEGVFGSLRSLYDEHPLAVCTSKPAAFARKIIEMFDLDGFFEFIDGGDVGVSKVTQLSNLLSMERVGPGSVMVGDRMFDLKAAHENGLSSVGVLWGYGSFGELSAQKPDIMLDKPQDLFRVVELLD
ncbi:HAD hydrolase-like protein [uncultured Pseudoteredinibacter sp.]|uniref:HAD hydrolase-like protein n=1 Tax=uncultured Pseudoteredinibacter sp. TaxID=1641701 RepID=UPI002631E8F4|nr:HAD hydrolase-like protein [uncultured Pseudoteredinibacter sp.]